jgi:arginine decarboxylase
MKSLKAAELHKQQEVEWSVDQSRSLYQIPAWSQGYFDINKTGHLIARPCMDDNQIIDLFELACALKTKGQVPPVLLRFTDILQHRVDELCSAFSQAMEQHQYNSRYTAVYPIKVVTELVWRQAVSRNC